jgi:hypothetical protein
MAIVGHRLRCGAPPGRARRNLSADHIGYTFDPFVKPLAGYRAPDRAAIMTPPATGPTVTLN